MAALKKLLLSTRGRHIMASRASRVVLCLLALLGASLGRQTTNTIFSFDNGKGDYQVLGSSDTSAQVLKLRPADLTCFGDFLGQDSALTLSSTAATQQQRNVSGGCFYKKSVEMLEKPCLQVATSFETLFEVQYSLPSDSFSTPAPRKSVDILQSLYFIVTAGEPNQMVDFRDIEGRFPGLIVTFSTARDSEYDSRSIPSLEGWVFMNGTVETGFSLTPTNVKSLNPGSAVNTVHLLVRIGYDYSTRGLSVNFSRAANFDDSSGMVGTGFVSFGPNLAEWFQDRMYVGFGGRVPNTPASSDLGSITVTPWTFNSDGPAPDVPRDNQGKPIDLNATEERRKARVRLIVSITVPTAVFLICLFCARLCVLHRRYSRLDALAKKYQIDELELLGRGPQSFSYKTLSAATKGFSSSELLGSGGFGSVYRGKLRLRSAQKNTNVAVKRISKTSHQGASEFLAEVKVIGQVQHRNLVRVLGWCHERGELLLVYDYMPNGSLDQHLFGNNHGETPGENLLTWSRRLKIVSGVAMALAYLHEEWDQRVIHRDVKSSNVMLDADFNARLGDFGLARLSDHAQAPPSTGVLAGTHGYLAPELGHTLKATEKTDVYSFGAMVLEVATGKRPLLHIRDRRTPEEVLLVDCVWGLYGTGNLLQAADGRLENAFDRGEMATLLKIGLLCSHPDPDERPTMREVLNIWKGASIVPPLPHTKPTPIFLSNVHGTTIRDGDTMPIIHHMQNSGNSLEGHSREPWEIELGGSFSTRELRSRPWKSIPLPM